MNPWEIVWKGNLLAIERHSTKGYERAVRPPGVRLILHDTNGNILLTEEFRSELNRKDFRLPGGKVFDDLESYLNIRGNESALIEAVMRAAKLEAKQETGVDEIKDLTIFSRSTAGASIEWDLFYLSGTITAQSEQELEAEEIGTGEALACAYPKFGDHFGFFLPLAGISTVAAIKNNPIDIKATSRLNQLYVELLKTNENWASDARRLRRIARNTGRRCFDCRRLQPTMASRCAG